MRTSGSDGIAPPVDTGARESFTIVLCSIDDEKCGRAVALYRRLFAGTRHEIVAIRDARSLPEAYNEAIARSAADIVVLSHDDVDVLAPDFAARISRHLQAFDAIGVAGSVRMDGPAIGWSGHPYLRGWITQRARDDPGWHVDGLDARLTAAGIVVLDGVLLAARRSTFAEVPFDAATFAGFHLYDIDWSYRASQAGFRLSVAGDLLVVHASRGRFGTTWQRYAERFCAKRGVGRSPPQPSSFIGVTFDTPDEVRTFFAILSGLNGFTATLPNR
ncbi:MAG: glycosyltransferase [Casimicrobiaceae bacterium]